MFHDALVHPETLALAARAETVAVGKRCGRHSTAQRFINKRLVDAARRHAVVVRLKGGDPMLFGRAQEEIDALCATRASSSRSCRASPRRSRPRAELGVSLTRRGVRRSVDVRDAARRRRRSGERLGRAAIAAADTGRDLHGRGRSGRDRRRADRARQARQPPGGRGRERVASRCAPLEDDAGGLPRLADEAFSGPVVLLLGEVFADALVREQFLAASRDLPAAVRGLTYLNVHACGCDGHTPRSIAFAPSNTTQLCRP